LGRTKGIDATLAKFNLDAIILPTDVLEPKPTAIAGYPLISGEYFVCMVMLGPLMPFTI
jgi:amidase